MEADFQKSVAFAAHLFGIKAETTAEDREEPQIPFKRIDGEKLLFEKENSFQIVETFRFGEKKTLSLFGFLLENGVDLSSSAAALKILNHARAESGNVLFVSTNEKKRILTLFERLSVKVACLSGSASFADGFETVFFFGEEKDAEFEKAKRLFFFEREEDAMNILKEKDYVIVLEER